MDFKVDQIVFERQPRFIDFDYHPQIVKSITDDAIIVFEQGINNTKSVLKICFSEEILNGEKVLVH